MRVALLLVRLMAPDERYREQWEADVAGARELGMSPSWVAFGAVRAAVVMPSRGAVVVGPLGIALKHAGTSRGRVLAIAVVSALMLLGGMILLFA